MLHTVANRTTALQLECSVRERPPCTRIQQLAFLAFSAPILPSCCFCAPVPALVFSNRMGTSLVSYGELQLHG